MAAASVYKWRRPDKDRAGLGARRHAGGNDCGADERGASDIDAGGGTEDGDRVAGTIVYGAGVFSADRETYAEGRKLYGQERETRAYCLTNSTRRFFARPTSLELSATG